MLPGKPNLIWLIFDYAKVLSSKKTSLNMPLVKGYKNVALHEIVRLG